MVDATRLRVLRDPQLDRQLRMEGYATRALVPGSVASDLLLDHRRLRSRAGTGFEADLTNPDTSYRREVDRLLSLQLEAHVTDVFVDHEPFLWNFLCKWPKTTEELYLHRDWMFVDERTGARSFTVWLALQDVTGANGRLRVLPRSHRLRRSDLAGPGLTPPWMAHEDVIRPRLRTLNIRAGHAVIMDNALVHCSEGNLTELPRVAVGCAVRRRLEPLVHFRRQDDRSAARFDVDRSFFMSHTPLELEARPPDIMPSEVISVAPPSSNDGLGPAELARLLDRPPPRNDSRRWLDLGRAAGSRLTRRLR